MYQPAAGRRACLALVAALVLAASGCAGKKEAASSPPGTPPATQAMSASSKESSGAASKPGFFSRLNPFSKKEASPTEEPPAKHDGTSQAANGKVHEEKGFFGRWFGGSSELPAASLERVQSREVTTAKGEVSPPAFEYDGLKLTLGETSKARIIATYGEPENIFFSEGAEEILIYRRSRQFDSLYIFLDSQGLVKDYIITKKQ